jgi:large subunit ribosomal protein L7/L12
MILIPQVHSLRSFKQLLTSIIFAIVVIPSTLLAQESAQPSKKILIEFLTNVAQQLEAKQYAETQQFFYLPPDFKPEMMAQLTKRDVINSSGVTALAKGGEFGKAIGVLRKSDVEEVANEHSAPLDQCYAMKMEQDGSRCKVLVHWTEGKFKILDINRVGKMDPAKVVAKANVPVKPWPTGAAPTKELLIKTLEVFLHRIENKHYDALRPNVYVPENFVMSRFHDSLQRRELSNDGIKILSQRGSFGKAVEVYAKLRAESLTKRVQVPVDESYGLVAKIAGEQGEALGHWTGDRFKLLRADDIGKLPEAVESEANAKAAPKKTSTPVAKPPTAKMDVPAIVEAPAKVEATTATLPKYETDKSVVMANYPAMVQAVAANPNDISLRARFVHSLLVIGNTPKAWKEATEIHALAPQNIEVVHAIDTCIEGLKKNGIFQVGVPTETIEALMGKPLKQVTNGEAYRWEYPIWNVEFNQGRFVKLARTEATTTAVATPKSSPAKVETKPVNEKRFGLKLISFEKRVSAIHLIRTEKELGLKDTIDLISKLPVVVFENLTKEEAETKQARYAKKNIVTEIVELGATTEKAAPTTNFNVEMTSFGSNKIAVIRVIRELNKGMSLRQAKQLVDNLPSQILEGVSKERAATAVENLNAAGAAAAAK